MARRDDLFGDLMELAARLPWRIGCVLAAVCFIVFHVIASIFSVATPPAHPGAMAPVVIHLGVYIIAYFLQFIVPAGFLIGAAVSFFKGSQRRSLFAKASAAPR